MSLEGSASASQLRHALLPYPGSRQRRPEFRQGSKQSQCYYKNAHSTLESKLWSMLTCVGIVEKAGVHSTTNNNITAPVASDCAESVSEVVTVMSLALSLASLLSFCANPGGNQEPYPRRAMNERKVSREPIWIFYPLPPWPVIRGENLPLRRTALLYVCSSDRRFTHTCIRLDNHPHALHTEIHSSNTYLHT